MPPRRTLALGEQPEAKGEAAQAAVGTAPGTGNSGETSATAPTPREQPAKPLEALPPDATPVQQYCFNTADIAADARFAWQAKKIEDMEGELAKRLALLESKTEELKNWLARRDEFSKRAQEKLVGFYTRMRPDAAALQLAAMEEETAAALLTKLETKAASAVMSEMDPARAARIASIISGAAKVPAEPRKKAAGGATAKPQEDGRAPQPPSGTKS
jgi:flagellar motility protein MotE (MotC chaperone)